ncbi:MAG: amino acid ABC transporter substrate-binding protein [Promethearchaeota archaeon]|nr:MAG: amino acid ABC transporter substrate-binding protein [Candidatus Lokiarchaeota archaeon]
MKREFAVVGMVACIAVGVLGGWFIPSPIPGAPRASLLDIIQNRGYIIIGTSADYEPFEYMNTSTIPATIVGFDVDMCNWIADKLGVAIQWSDRNFGGLIAACAVGKVDMVAAAMTYTVNRSSFLAASVTYITVGQAVIVRNDSVLTITSLADLEGTNVGVQSGTTLLQQLINASVTTYTEFITVDAMMLALIGGSIAAAYIDEPVFLAWSKTYPLKMILQTGTEDFALWTRYGEPELLYEINNVILDSFLDGRMYDNLEKWLNITVT